MVLQSLLVISLNKRENPQVCEGSSHMRVFRTPGLFENAQGPLMIRLGLLIVSALRIDCTQAGEGGRDPTVLRAQSLFPDLYCLQQQGFGQLILPLDAIEKA